MNRTARREKSLDVLPISDTGFCLHATLVDTSVSIADPSDVELIHDLTIDATVGLPGLVIEEISAESRHQPYGECAFTSAAVSRLRGLSLTRGYRREVLGNLGGTRGCSHFLTLALDMSAANILSIYLRMREEVAASEQNRADGTWAATGLRVEPHLMNACFALRADSPVQRQALDRLRSDGGEDL